MWHRTLESCPVLQYKFIHPKTTAGDTCCSTDLIRALTVHMTAQTDALHFHGAGLQQMRPFLDTGRVLTVTDSIRNGSF